MYRGILLLFLLAYFFGIESFSQEAISRRLQSYNLSSGNHDGSDLKNPSAVFKKIISYTDATWIRLKFNSANLGKNSYIVIESLEDKSKQVLSTVVMEQWNFSSAYFNGDSLLISLYAGPGDKNIFFNITEIYLGEAADQSVNKGAYEPNGITDLCDTDNRVLSNEKAIGRIITEPSGLIGTGFILFNGKIATAGHVLYNISESGDDLSLIEFNVPTSHSDGGIRHPDASNQYSFKRSYIIDKHENGLGDDWAVFYTNVYGGKGPKDWQNAFFYVEQNNSFQTASVTGYGDDDGTANRVQQTATGQNQSSSGNIVKYSVYTRDHNSGSPVINSANGKVVGIHTQNDCSSGYNSGTSFFNSSLWNTINPVINLYVHQKLESGSELTGSYIDRWTGSLTTGNFQNYSVGTEGALIENAIYGNYETFRAKQDMTESSPKEKFNSWTVSTDIINHQKFLIEYEAESELVSKFKKTYEGSIIKNEYPEVSGLAPSTDLIEFKDPWLIDYEDPVYNGTTYRNRGMDAAFFKSRLAPFYPDYNSYYESDLYLGVFLDQDPALGMTNYSVRSPIQQPQDVYLSQTGKYHKFHFGNWTSSGTDPLTQANIVSGYYESPIVFRNGSATVTANLKGSELSDNQNGYYNNSQRKLIRTGNGQLHKVYESMGYVWYEKSTDNGSTWNIANEGKPLSSNESKSPSIDILNNTNNIVGIAYQEKNGNTYQIKFAWFDSYGVAYNNSIVQDNPGWLYPDSYSYDSKPVIAWRNTNELLIVWQEENDPGLHYRLGAVYQFPGGVTWHSQVGFINGTDETSTNPTLVTRKDAGTLIFHLAFQKEDTHIKYCTLTPDAQHNLSISSIESPSTGDGFTTRKYPSISISSGYPTLVWIGKAFLGDWVIQVTKRSKGVSIWDSNFGKYGSNAHSPTSESGVIAWSEYDGSFNKFLRYGNIKSFSTFGKDIQLSNAPNLNSMYAVSFRNFSQPYYFQTTPSVGSIAKENSITSKSARQGIITKKEAEFYAILSDVLVDNENIKFANIENSTSITNTNELNQFLITEPFSLNKGSDFSFSVAFGVTDSSKAINDLKDNSSIKFSVELIDANSNEKLGLLDEKLFKKNELISYKVNNYKVNSNGIENRSVKLCIKTSNDFKGIYTYADIITESELLNKTNLQEISYTGKGVISSYSLFQNYPNPFNPSTTITYQLPQNGFVTLKIYDVLGNEVTTLVNEYKTTGSYDINFNASKLSSGVYIYSIRVNDYSATKKLVLMK